MKDERVADRTPARAGTRAYCRLAVAGPRKAISATELRAPADIVGVESGEIVRRQHRCRHRYVEEGAASEAERVGAEQKLSPVFVQEADVGVKVKVQRECRASQIGSFTSFAFGSCPSAPGQTQTFDFVPSLNLCSVEGALRCKAEPLPEAEET